LPNSLERLNSIRIKQQQEREAVKAKVKGLAPKVAEYKGQVNQGLFYWYGQGLNDIVINHYQLGYTPHCPLYSKSPSFVIPIYQNNELVSIRHRLQYPNGSGKYLPEFKGLPAQIFNVDRLQENWTGEIDMDVIIVEGEVKAMLLTQMGYKAIGIPGITNWDEEWLGFLWGVNKVYLAFDPATPNNQEQMAYCTARIANSLTKHKITVNVAKLPMKPDDFFVKGNGTSTLFNSYLRQARRTL
jgi:hypothetical protein